LFIQFAVCRLRSLKIIARNKKVLKKIFLIFLFPRAAHSSSLPAICEYFYDFLRIDAKNVDGMGATEGKKIIIKNSMTHSDTHVSHP